MTRNLVAGKTTIEINIEIIAVQLPQVYRVVFVSRFSSDCTIYEFEISKNKYQLNNCVVF